MSFIQKKATILLVWISLLSFISANAQPKSIKGRVTDQESGKILPGFSIFRKGTIAGTVTDRIGKFYLIAEEGQELVVSGKGYQDRLVTVRKGRFYHIAVKRIPMPEELLTEAGYGKTAPELAIGSTGEVRHGRFNQGLIATPQQLIAGKVAGLRITPVGGAPGGDVEIRLRGTSSLLSKGNPLFVVDGIPFDYEGITGIRNPLSIIHPADIESFTVLKDAAATAIYGSRGSNGVILITSKSARQGQPLRINYSTYMSFGELTRTADVLSTNEFRSLVSERLPSQAAEWLGNTSTDWQSEIYRQSVSTDHNLSLTGEQGGVPFRVSYGFTNENGVLETDKFTRVTMALGIQPTLIENRLKMQINIKAMLNNNRFASENAIASAYQFDPTQAVANDSWFNYFTWTDAEGLPVASAPVNPVAQLLMVEDYSRIVSSIGNIILDYRFLNIPELKANLHLAYDATNGAGEIIEPENYPGKIDHDNGGGTFREYKQKRKNNLVDLYFNYTGGFPRNLGNVDAMAGFSRQFFNNSGSDHEFNRSETIVRHDLNLLAKSSLLSFYARLHYNIRSKYLLSATIRHDGLTHPNGDLKWGTYPAFALGWRISEENFLKNSQNLNNLKLRFSYGISGRNDYLYSVNTYLPTVGTSHIQPALNNRWHWTNRQDLYDPDVKWEETLIYNGGLDFGFFRNRINGSVDVYRRITSNLHSLVPDMSGQSGNSLRLANVGSMENRGIEFTLNTILASARQFLWEIGFNGAYNENLITHLEIPGSAVFPAIFTGLAHPGSSQTVKVHASGFPANSFFVYEQIYSGDGKPIEGVYGDKTGSQLLPGDNRYIYGNEAPDFMVGLNTSLKWRKLDVSASARSHKGNYLYNSLWASGALDSHLFHPDGFLGNLSRNARDNGFATPQVLSDYYVSDASFIKIDYVTMGLSTYNLFNSIERLRLYVTLQNVKTFTRYKGLDPEQSNGIEGYQYQLPQNMIFGISIDF